MEVILLKNVKNLGEEGVCVKVKDGYARNYLVPRKLAVPYSDRAVRVFEAKQKKKAVEAEKKKRLAEEMVKTISRLSLTIPAESGANDMLFGSVTAEAISHALKEEGLDVDRKNIIIEEPIKKLGIYNVEVKLHPEVKAALRVWVVKK